MSKRFAGGTTLKGRKRRKNGISSSSAILGLSNDHLGKPQYMPVWHTCTSDPTVSQQSTVPISSKPRVEEDESAKSMEETFDATMFDVTTSVMSTQPKWERGNDSVSRCPMVLNCSANLLNRQRWRCGYHFDQQYWTSSSVMMASKKIRPFLNVPAVFQSPDNIDVAIALPQYFIVLPASCFGMRVSHCIDLRYVHLFLTDLFFMFRQVWNGEFFQKTALNNLGFRFYAAHEHTPCPSADSTYSITVIDVNGVHYIDIQFCACTEDVNYVERYRQLLRVGWYPASFQRPKTAFTFNVLDTYHKLSLQGKLNLYDFFSSILQKTDNCGQKKLPVSCFFPLN